jgi:hypothetical protein
LSRCAQAGGGRFVAAIRVSHRGLVLRAGSEFGELGVCRDGVWAGKTYITVCRHQGCGEIGSSRACGALCCTG